MTAAQFAKKTGWPLEELNSMPFVTVYLPLLGLYSMHVEFVDEKTGKIVETFSDYSWRDAPEGAKP